METNEKENTRLRTLELFRNFEKAKSNRVPRHFKDFRSYVADEWRCIQASDLKEIYGGFETFCDFSLVE